MLADKCIQVSFNKEKEQQELMLQLQMQLDKLMKNNKQQQQKSSNEIYTSNDNESNLITSANRESLINKNGRIAAERAKTAPNSMAGINQANSFILFC
jgi:hypothetical protein